MDANDTTHHEHRALAFIRRLLDENVQIAGDVVEVGVGTWGLHGVVPVDGEVLVAEFDSYAAAREVLAAIAVAPPSGGDHRLA